jgi:toxin ParE1/3/4
MSVTSPFRVRWTATAEDDLTAIVEFIAVENVSAALTVFDRISACAGELYALPERGRIVPELQKFGIVSYRELLPTPWRIIYRIESRVVFVTAVLDGRRDLSSLLLERIGR